MEMVVINNYYAPPEGYWYEKYISGHKFNTAEYFKPWKKGDFGFGHPTATAYWWS